MTHRRQAPPTLRHPALVGMVMIGLTLPVVVASHGIGEHKDPSFHNSCVTTDPEVTLDPDNALRIGVRSDARPFSYRTDQMREVWSAAPPAPLALRSYTGYVTKICDAVLSDMLLERPTEQSPDLGRENVSVVDVDCLLERDAASYTPRESRLEYLGKEFDILCDPATISNARRHGFILSPPVFLSGMGLVSRRSNQPRQGPCPSKPLIGYVRNTNAAQAGIPRVIQSNELEYHTPLLKKYMDGNNQCSTALYDQEIVHGYDSHSEAAKAFCNREFHFYLGDREVILYSTRGYLGCHDDLEGAGLTYSNDRYAIFGKFSYRDTRIPRDLLIARFFEILSQKIMVSPSLLDTAYQESFLEDPSRKLESFYWNIRGPK